MSSNPPSYSVDDNSPLITYSPPEAWSASSDDDQQVFRYSGRTYTRSNTSGSTATFEFKGTSVTVYGSKRQRYGKYSVTVDGAKSGIMSANAASSTDEDYNTTLFERHGLPNGLHTITVTNESDSEDSLIDIDFITWGGQLAQRTDNVTAQSTNIFLGSSASNRTGTGWDNANGELHTKNPGDTVTWSFTGKSRQKSNLHQHLLISYYSYSTGETIAVYGYVGNRHGGYSISLDGEAPTSYNATRPSVDRGTQQLFYLADGLSKGTHTLQLISGPLQNQRQTRISSVTYWSLLQPDKPTTESQTAVDPGQNGNQSRPATGLIAAVVGAAVAIFLLVLGALFYFCYYRKRRNNPTIIFPTNNNSNNNNRQTTTSAGSMVKVDVFDIDESVPGTLSHVSESRTLVPSILTAPTSTARSSRDVDRMTPLRSLYGPNGGTLVLDGSGMQVASRNTSSNGNKRQVNRAISLGPKKSRARRYSQQMKNFFLAKPGSSMGGSAYAPSTAFTSEISERPLGSEATALSNGSKKSTRSKRSDKSNRSRNRQPPEAAASPSVTSPSSSRVFAVANLV